eukprot:1085250-Ditylum_brightwellii.AAC.1
MQKNLLFGRRITVKEWVAQVLELNKYLKDFPAHNRNSIQPLDKDKLLDILEYRVPVSWHREFTLQGFDPVDQGLQKFVEFCTCLESCEPSTDKPKGGKTPKSENAGKLKAEGTTSTKPAGKRKFYCDVHGRNRTHNTEDCFELKQHAKHAKLNTTRNKADKASYKDLNAFVNAKVTANFNKAKKNLKTQRKEKEAKLNAFDKFCSLNVESSDKEDEPNKHAPTNVDNNNLSASCLLSNNSDSNVK